MIKNNIDQFSMLVRIKKKIINLIINSTSHGLPKVFSSSSKVIRYMWAFFTIISTCICSFLIIKSINKYYEYEVTTKIRTKSQFKALFPSVTICNMNFFTSEQSIEFIYNLKHLANYSNDPELFFFENGAKSILQSQNKSNKIYSDSIDKLIIKCFHLLESCNLSEFSYVYSPYYGNCYTFNSGYDSRKNLKSFDQLISTTRSSRNQGLKLILNVSVPKELKFMTPSIGAVIFIHNQSNPAFVYRPVIAATGVGTNIGLEKIQTIQNPKPLSQCDPDTQDPEKYNSELFKRVHEYYGSYKRIICIDFCFQRLSLQKCGCNQPTFPSNYESLPCANNTECIRKHLSLFAEGNYVNDVCIPECPLECQIVSFTKTISINKYSNDVFDTMMSEHLNLSSSRKFSEDVAQVNVYYESLDYTEIVEFATIDFIDLLSNIGGIAGLFLGISVLSLVEILEIILDILLMFKISSKILI